MKVLDFIRDLKFNFELEIVSFFGDLTKDKTYLDVTI